MFVCTTYLFIYLLKFSCRKWNKGLNNEVINNDPLLYKCEFKTPNICHIDIISSFMDYSKVRKVDCFKNNPNSDEVKNIWRNSYNRYGTNDTLYDFQSLIYPETNNNNFTFSKYDSFYSFYKSITKNMIFTNDSEKLKEINPEVMLLKNKENFEIKINLKFNKELSENRIQIITEDNFPNNNILFLYIDMLSRPHFFRKMNYLTQFLSKFNSNKNSSYEVFQFMKYQSFPNDYSNSGIQTIFYETTKKIRYEENKNFHLLTLLKNKGYITAQSANFCFKEFLLNQQNYNFFKDTNIEEYDYENIAMFCDPIFLNEMKTPSIKKCLYGKNSFEYVLEYGYQFWTKYTNNKKFLRLGFFEGKEKTGEVIKYLDYYLYQFFENLYQNNYLNNTIVFLVSGQGNSFNDLFNHIFYINYDFYLEKYLGTLFILLDKEGLNLKESDLINIRSNQQNMVTAYDIRETLKNIAENKIYNNTKEKNEDNLNNNNLGESLFKFINSLKRNCKMYSNINDVVCRCHDF